MMCRDCGRENDEGAAACQGCGASLATPVPPGGSTPIATIAALREGFRVAGRYEILSRAGKGGMGWVYRALDHTLGEVVALKILYPQYAAEEQVLLRFKREARLSRKITHPNVVRVHDLGVWNDLVYISMEFLEGVNLKRHILEGGPLPLGECLRITEQVCAGLNAAHALGIVHRDVKPQNVFLLSGGRVAKLVDFGISRSADLTQASQDGNVAGTPGYMAPELAQVGVEPDWRCDLYSVGAILYEMLTATVPFRGPTPLQVIMHQMREDPAPPSNLRPDLPPDVDAVVSRAMRRDRETRYQSALDIARDLGVALAPDRAAPEPRPLATPPSAPAPAHPPAPTSPAERGAGRGPAYLRASVVAGVALAVVVAVAISLDRTASPPTRMVATETTPAWVTEPPAATTEGPAPRVEAAVATAEAAPEPAPPEPAAPATEAGTAQPEVTPEGVTPIAAGEAAPTTPVAAPVAETDPSRTAPAPAQAVEPPPAQSPGTAIEGPPPGASETPRAREIEQLLARGSEHLQNDRLLLPASNNAWESFRAVLALDPQNQAAQDGIVAVRNRYISMAKKAREKNDLEGALSLLERALKVDPRSEVAQVLAKKVRQEIEERDDRARRAAAAAETPTPAPSPTPEPEKGFFDSVGEFFGL